MAREPRRGAAPRRAARSGQPDRRAARELRGVQAVPRELPAHGRAVPGDAAPGGRPGEPGACRRGRTRGAAPQGPAVSPRRGRALRLALFGHPVGHSRSRDLFETIARLGGPEIRYEPVDVRPRELATALARLAAGAWDGANVTVPHKRAAWRLCGRLAGDARQAGAVNVLVRAGDGTLVGHNTDGTGFLAALDGVPVARDRGAHRRAALLGSGGAAAGVGVALAARGVRLLVVSRAPGRIAAPLDRLADQALGWDDPALAEAVRGCDLVVQATPLGTAGGAEGPADVPLPDAALGPDQLVVDLVYNPWQTPFLRRARAAGACAINGWPMLVHQAAQALDLWLGEGHARWVHEAAAELETRDPRRDAP
ncbi:MAG: hypothetical protein D6738_04680 [Acidobacteria bacterium]|nr:MAG: hypothetical protein D6738_04680 [Acidobacteriota bacterium]